MLGPWTFASGCSCFVAGTAISTPGGSRPIETLRAGEVVVAWRDGALVARRVRRLYVGVSRELLDLRTASATLVGVTPGHRFVEPGSRLWRTADLLAEGDRIGVVGGAPGAERLVGIVRRSLPAPVPVYNLSLDGEGGFLANGVVAGQKSEVLPARLSRVPLLAAALVLGTGCFGAPVPPSAVASAATDDTDDTDASAADTDTDPHHEDYGDKDVC